MAMPLTLFRLVGTTYKVVNHFDTRMTLRVCVARLVDLRGALEREWAGTQTQVRHEDENPNPNPNPNGSLKKNLWGHSFISPQTTDDSILFAKCDNDCSVGLLLLVSTEARLLMEPWRRETVSDLLRGQKVAHRGVSPTRPSCHLPSRPRVW